MLFKKTNDFKSVENFDPSKCEMEKKKDLKFDKDEVTMGCSEGCWSGCIGFPNR